MKRLLTSLVLIPFFFYIVIFAPYWAFMVVLALVASACFYEYLGIAAAHAPAAPNPRENPFGYIAGLLVLILPWYDLGFLLTISALLLLLFALRAGSLALTLPVAALTSFGIVYVFGAWRCGAALRELSPWWLLFATAANWVGDTFALYTGKLIGRHKLAPNVSPAKTWEGSIGSLLATVVLGVAYLKILFPKVGLAEVGLIQAIVLSIAANVAGQFGDLAESAIKRGAGIKDSGNLLPGHGGWLDRVDSSLFSIPVVYWLIQFRWILP
jgi:phosphatidate cytidylyltransferase